MKNKKQKRYRYYVVCAPLGFPIPDQPENGYTLEDANARIAREIQRDLIRLDAFNLTEEDIKYNYTIEPIRCWKW